MEDPYIPTSWGQNQKGMQAEEEVGPEQQERAEGVWLKARTAAVEHAEMLLKEGIHKQLTNRLLEPFMWHTVIVTATEWDNFFHLRNNAMAHPDIQIVAKRMQDLYETGAGRLAPQSHWHWPLIQQEELLFASRVLVAERGVGADIPRSIQNQIDRLCKVSVARCARVSYLTHEGKRDLQADIDLHDRLLTSGHMSPFEHVARPATLKDKDIAVARWTDSQPEGHVGPAGMWFGNFRGWVQYRKTLAGESDMLNPGRQ
jgi:hypothetical protein